MPRSQCIQVACKTHDACTGGSGGLCIAYLDVCSSLDPRPFAGKFCHYETDPCWTDADCGNAYCFPDFDNTGFSCGVPPCPG